MEYYQPEYSLTLSIIAGLVGIALTVRVLWLWRREERAHNEQDAPPRAMSEEVRTTSPDERQTVHH